MADLFAQQTIGTPAAPSAEAVEMVAPDGSVQTVRGAHVGTLQALGYKPMTPELRQQLEDKAKYGGTLGEVGAAGLGVARGLTFGLSDLGIKIGEGTGILPEGTVEGARKLRDFNPTASLAGELGSFAIPALAAAKLGTVSKVARGASGGIASVDTLGTTLGQAATSIVGKELGKYAAPAVKAAAEAAIFQAGHNISEESLANRDLTAEAVLAHTGEAAILGGGIGAGLPLMLRAGQKATAAALESAPVEWVVGEAGKRAAKFLDPQRAAQLYSGAISQGKLLDDTIEGEAFRGSVKNLWDRGFYKGGIVDIDDATGLLRQVESGRLLNQQEMLQRGRMLSRRAGEVMGAVKNEADDVVKAMGKPSAFAVSEQDADRLLDQIWKYNKTGAISNATETKFVDMVSEDLGRIRAANTFEELHELRQGLDSRIGPKNFLKLENKEKEIVKEVRRIVADKIRNGLGELEQAGAISGGSLERWNNANSIFGDLRTVNKAIAKQTGRTEANVNVLGLRFRDIGIGAIGGGVLGGPAGVGIALANKAIQTDQGLLARAMLGERLQALGWLQKTTGAAEKSIARSVSSFVRGVDAAAVGSAITRTPLIGELTAIARGMPTPITDAKARAESDAEWFDKTRKELLAIAADPQTAAEKVGSDLSMLSAQAPKTTDTVVSKWLAVNDYLLKQMPKNPGNPMNILAPQWKPADYEISRFRDVVRVARNPLLILGDIKAGTVTRAQTAAVQTLYPSLYQTMFDQVRDAVTKPGVALPYEKRLQLGTLFPGVEASMVPGFATRMNTAQQEKEASPKQGYRAAGVSKSTKGSRHQTGLDRLSTR